MHPITLGEYIIASCAMSIPYNVHESELRSMLNREEKGGKEAVDLSSRTVLIVAAGATVTSTANIEHEIL